MKQKKNEENVSKENETKYICQSKRKMVQNKPRIERRGGKIFTKKRKRYTQYRKRGD